MSEEKVKNSSLKEEYRMMSPEEILKQRQFDNMMSSLEVLLENSNKFIDDYQNDQSANTDPKLVNDDSIIYGDVKENNKNKDINTSPVNVDEINFNGEEAEVLDASYEEINEKEENKYASINLESDVLAEHPESNGVQRITKRNSISNVSDKTKIFGIIIVAVIIVLFILFAL